MGIYALSFRECNATLTFNPGYVDNWNIYEAVQGLGYNLTLINSDIGGWINIFYDSHVSLSNASIEKINTFGNSSVSMTNVTTDNMYCSDSSSTSIVNSTIKGMFQARSNALVLINSSILNGGMEIGYGNPSVTIINSTVSGTPFFEIFTITCLDDSIISIIKSTINGGTRASERSSVFITNSTVPKIHSLDHSLNWLLNSRIISIETYDEAVVFKGWYLTVNLTLNNEPLEGTYVEVYYAHNGSLAISGTTGHNGKVRFILPEMVIRSDMEVEYVGNYLVRVIYDGAVKQDQVTLDTNKLMTISALDAISPTISITSPDIGSEINSSSVIVTWNGSDVSGIDHYEVKLDEGSWIDVGMDISYVITGVRDGTHTVFVKAVDKADNSKVEQVDFTVNTSLIGGSGWTDGIAIIGGFGILVIAGLIIVYRRKTS